MERRGVVRFSSFPSKVLFTVLPIEAHHLARARPAFTKHWWKKSTEPAVTVVSCVLCPFVYQVDAAELEAEMLCVHVTHTKRKQKGKEIEKTPVHCVINDQAKEKRKEK